MTERRWGLDKVTEADILAGGFSTPWDAPFIPPFPFSFRNAEVLTVFWRTDPKAMQLLAPPPGASSGGGARDGIPGGAGRPNTRSTSALRRV